MVDSGHYRRSLGRQRRIAFPAALARLRYRSARRPQHLSPHGYVVIHGELWEAEVIGGKTVEPGSRVQVREMRGLTLLVEPDDGAG